MDQLMKEITAFATENGIKPGTVIQRAGVGSGATWSRWLAGGSCTLETADRIRRYLAEHRAAKGDAA